MHIKGGEEFISGVTLLLIVHLRRLRLQVAGCRLQVVARINCVDCLSTDSTTDISQLKFLSTPVIAIFELLQAPGPYSDS